MSVVERLLPDVARFAKLAITSTDLDPTYPVLKAVQQQRGLTKEQRAWSSVCFVGWYRLASSLQAPDDPAMPREAIRRLGTGVERRSLRTEEKMHRHWRSVCTLIDMHGSVVDWLQDGFTASPVQNWQQLRTNFEKAWGNGRWASYKLAEVLREVNGWPLYPPDMGNDGSTGPVAGLHLLYGKPPPLPKSVRIDLYDKWGAALMNDLNKMMGTLINLAQVETVLCDFHNLYDGTYYVGHDIDVMLKDLQRPEVPDYVRQELFAARRRAIPHDYLGELRGWTSVDLRRRRAYRDEGLVLAR